MSARDVEDVAATAAGVTGLRGGGRAARWRVAGAAAVGTGAAALVLSLVLSLAVSLAVAVAVDAVVAGVVLGATPRAIGRGFGRGV